MVERRSRMTGLKSRLAGLRSRVTGLRRSPAPDTRHLTPDSPLPILVKICGITRVEDAVLSAEQGAAFLGLVFVPGSPRRVSTQMAQQIVRAARSCEGAADGGLRIAGVFLHQSLAEIGEIAESVGLDLVQLHGHENDEFVRSIGRPVIKAVHVGKEALMGNAYPSASWLLFDTFDGERGGGTGRSFDWSLLAGIKQEKPFFLAGGITPENVVDAITLVRPDGIDLSSGVEESPGIKSPEKIRTLFERVRRA